MSVCCRLSASFHRVALKMYLKVAYSKWTGTASWLNFLKGYVIINIAVLHQNPQPWAASVCIQNYREGPMCELQLISTGHIIKHTQFLNAKLLLPPCMMSLRYWLLFELFFLTRAFWPGGVWTCSPPEVLRPNKEEKTTLRLIRQL